MVDGPPWFDGGKRSRASEEIALPELNAEVLQKLEFPVALDALGYDLGPQHLAQQLETPYQRLF